MFFFCWITEIVLRPLESENKITIIKATEDDETVTLNVTLYHANNVPSFINLISFKDKYIFFKRRFPISSLSCEANKPSACQFTKMYCTLIK